PFEWACSTAWLNSPARSPSALPEIMNKGTTSSSRLICATTPHLRSHGIRVKNMIYVYRYSICYRRCRMMTIGHFHE
ncbi:MAG: hypothetical protein VB143_07855, partial [Burkholderia sp.]